MKDQIEQQHIVNKIRESYSFDIKMPLAKTIQIDKCEKIILRQSGIDVKCELNNDNIRKFKQMYINGIGFVRSEAFFDELEDRLPKNIRWQVMEIVQDLLEDWKV